MAYKRVKYIDTQKTYFQTSLLTGPDIKCVLDMSLIELTAGDNGILGTTAEFNSSDSFNILVNTGRLQWGFYIAGSAYDNSGFYNLDNRCIVELSSSAFSVYDTVLSSYTSNYSFTRIPTQSSNGIRIGSGLANNAMGTYRFYEITVYDGNTIVGHFLPYEDTTTGYGVLYDTVSNTYFSGVTASKVVPGPSVLYFEEDAVNVSYSSTTTAVSLIAPDATWSATTVPDWITVSPLTGSGTTAITFSIAENQSISLRSGTVIMTSSNSVTAEITFTQDGKPAVVIDRPIYRSGNLVKKMYRSGELIYLRLNPPT